VFKKKLPLYAVLIDLVILIGIFFVPEIYIDGASWELMFLWMILHFPMAQIPYFLLAAFGLAHGSGDTTLFILLNVLAFASGLIQTYLVFYLIDFLFNKKKNISAKK
jgi:hypothetical protein